MKHFSTMLFMAFAMLWQGVQAAETEPNDTATKANTLSVNGSNTGKISTASDADWWKETTTGDGKLEAKSAYSLLPKKTDIALLRIHSELSEAIYMLLQQVVIKVC